MNIYNLIINFDMIDELKDYLSKMKKIGVIKMTNLRIFSIFVSIFLIISVNEIK